MGDIPPFKASVKCKTEPRSCFYCKTDILWVVHFLLNKGDMCERIYYEQIAQQILLTHIWEITQHFSGISCSHPHGVA
jgi:hypothetical protein